MSREHMLPENQVTRPRDVIHAHIHIKVLSCGKAMDFPPCNRVTKGRDIDVRSIVLELPPAPAALVLVGLAFATLSALSAAAFLLIAVFGPPGGDKFRPLLTPAEAGGEFGEDGLGED